MINQFTVFPNTIIAIRLPATSHPNSSAHSKRNRLSRPPCPANQRIHLFFMQKIKKNYTMNRMCFAWMYGHLSAHLGILYMCVFIYGMSYCELANFTANLCRPSPRFCFMRTTLYYVETMVFAQVRRRYGQINVGQYEWYRAKWQHRTHRRKVSNGFHR